MTLHLATKRLKTLDAMRGFAILAMVPFHMFLFGGLGEGGLGLGGDGGQMPELFVVDWSPPLATGLILFFFVTGMSLAVSLARRGEQQNPLDLFRHVVFRYGLYIVIGVASELIMYSLLWGSAGVLIETITRIILGVGFSSPIIGLSFGAMLAFPFVLKLSGPKLAAAAVTMAAIVSLVLYFVLLPQASTLPSVSVLTLLITGMFAVLKGLPMILLGAAVGKFVLGGVNVTKLFLSGGGVIGFAYILIPTLLGTYMLHILLAMWAYPHSILFVAGISLFMFGLFQVCDARNITLSPWVVLGRSSIFVYYGHFIIDFTLMMLIGTENLSMGLLLGLMVGVTAAIWIVLYFYSKQRWGPIATWYQLTS